MRPVNLARILVLDSQPTVGQALAFRCASEAWVEAVEASSSMSQAVRLVAEFKPSLIVSERVVGDGSGLQLVSSFAVRGDPPPVVFLTDEVPNAFLIQVLRLGVAGVLSKADPLDHNVAQMRRATEGARVFAEEIQSRIAFVPEKDRYVLMGESPVESLSGRQIEVLRLLAVGRTVKEVARLMHLSPKSVDSHKYRIMHKLQIHDRVELARFAIREGLIDA